MQHGSPLPPPTVDERIAAVQAHLAKSVEWKGPRLGILEMRMHYSAYFKGLDNIRPFRNLLVQAQTDQEVLSILQDIRTQLSQPVLAD